jgi:RimJ/RimL family protein N-acetyltransferase
MQIPTRLRSAQSTFTRRNGKGHWSRTAVRITREVRKRKFDQVTLWVLEANQRARLFYESFGFVKDGTTKDDDHWKTFVIREVRYRLNLPKRPGD